LTAASKGGGCIYWFHLLQSPEKVVAKLAERGVHGNYVVFFAYIQPTPKEREGIWSAAEEMVILNSK
jgi:hypothetical protein